MISRRNLYLTTHNTYNRQTSTHPAGFEPAMPSNERPHTHTWDWTATEVGNNLLYVHSVIIIATNDLLVKHVSTFIGHLQVYSIA
jgi:hypothetical protein